MVAQLIRAGCCPWEPGALEHTYATDLMCVGVHTRHAMCSEGALCEADMHMSLPLVLRHTEPLAATRRACDKQTAMVFIGVCIQCIHGIQANPVSPRMVLGCHPLHNDRLTNVEALLVRVWRRDRRHAVLGLVNLLNRVARMHRQHMLGLLLQQSTCVIGEALQPWAALLQQLAHNTLRPLQDALQLFDTRLRGAQPLRLAQLPQLLCDARVLSDVGAVQTAHVWPLHTAQEPPVREVRQHRDNRCCETPTKQGHAKEGSTSHRALWIVEKAVDPCVRQALRVGIDEKVAIQPAKRTQHTIRRPSAPHVHEDEKNAQHIPQPVNVVGPGRITAYGQERE